MKKIFYAIIICTLLPFISEAQKTYSSYKEAMAEGKSFNDNMKYNDAIKAYQQAQQLGKSAEDKAEAIFLEAKATSRRPIEGQRRDDVRDQQRKRAEDEKRLITSVTVLPGASDDLKARAYKELISFYISDEFTSSYSKDGLKNDLYKQILDLKNLSPQVRIKYLLDVQNNDALAEVIDSKVATDDDKTKAIFYMEKFVYGDAAKAKKVESILGLPKASTSNKVAAIKKSAEFYNKASKVEDAARVLKQMDALPGVEDKDKQFAYDVLGQVELYNKNPKGAESYFNKIMDLKSLSQEEKADALIVMGDRYKTYKSFDNAIKEFEKAAEMRNITDGIKAKAYYNLGLLYYEQLNYADARKVFKKTDNLKLDSAMIVYKTTALQYIGTSFYKEKNYKEAATAFGSMAEVKNITGLEEAAARYMQGQSHLAGEDYKAARKAYSKTLENTEASKLNKFQAGIDIITSYEKENKLDDAAQAYAPLFVIYNTNPYDKILNETDQRTFATARTKFNNDFWDKAKEWGDKADNYQSAIKLLETRLANDEKLYSTDTKRVYHTMAGIYAKQGKKDLAKKNYQAVIDVDKNATDYYKKDAEKKLSEL